MNTAIDGSLYCDADCVATPLYRIAPQGGFDARFFLYCCSDPQALVHAAVDNSETVHLAWLSPQEALDASDRGEIFLAPPQWYHR